jgi:hypothetical protein
MYASIPEALKSPIEAQPAKNVGYFATTAQTASRRFSISTPSATFSSLIASGS